MILMFKMDFIEFFLLFIILKKPFCAQIYFNPNILESLRKYFLKIIRNLELISFLVAYFRLYFSLFYPQITLDYFRLNQNDGSIMTQHKRYPDV